MRTYYVIWWKSAYGTELMTGPFRTHEELMSWLFTFRIRPEGFSEYKPSWIGKLEGWNGKAGFDAALDVVRSNKASMIPESDREYLNAHTS